MKGLIDLGGKLTSALFTFCPYSVKNEIPPQDGGHLRSKLTSRNKTNKIKLFTLKFEFNLIPSKMPIMNVDDEDSDLDDILDIQLIFEASKKKR